MLGRAYRALLAGLGLLAGLAVAWLAVMVSLDVALRNLGLYNFPWVIEVAEYVLYASTLLAAPWVLAEGAHVRVDVLTANLPPGPARALEIFADLLGLAVSGALGWYGLAVTREAYALESLLFKELVIPEWWILAWIPLCAALLVTEFVLRLARASARSDGDRPLDEGF